MQVAIAGAGLMGRWHAHYARRCGASVCAVADPALAPGELRKRFPGAAAFSSVEPLLNDVRPDVLHVCSPSETHPGVIEAALRAGVHVLVEKPLAATVSVTEQLLARAAERNLLLVPVHQFPFQDGVLQTASALSGMGDILHFDAVICSAGGAHLPEDRLDALVPDILPHPLSLLDRLFPRILPEIQWSAMRTRPGEWRIHGEARQISISILVSMNGRPTEASLRLTGSHATARLDLFHGFAVIETGGVSRLQKIAHPFKLSAGTFRAAAQNLLSRTVQRAPAYPGLRRLIAQFYAAVEQGSAPPLSAQHSIDVARARDCLASAAFSDAVSIRYPKDLLP